MKYSIIIPHRDSLDTLSRLLCSIPDRPDIEVIIVDNTITPIKSEQITGRGNFELLHSNPERGAGGARNVGMENASGEWLIFADADDYFNKDAFEYFDRHYNSIADIIYFKSTSVYSDTLLPADRAVGFNRLVDNYIKNKDSIPLKTEFNVPWAKMIRHAIIRENNILFDEVPASNDMMFSLLTGLSANKIDVDQAEVYCVTVCKGSITNKVSWRNLESRFNVNIRINEVLKKNGLPKNASLMYFIFQSLSFGFIKFLGFVYKAAITGNLFVGWRSWFRTLFLNKRYKQYEVK